MFHRTPLPRGLYLVATPIGAARDITLRALDILASADVLAAEDTRTLRHLMDLHGVPLDGRPLLSYHDHNGERQRPEILRRLAEGQSVAYCSDAGTPLIADPGFGLVREVAAAEMLVTAAPGPSAAITALCLSGLPSDRFGFVGFAPSSGGARTRWLQEVATSDMTLIAFESPSRVHRTLSDLCKIGGETRPAALCRELTKRFEEIRRGTLGSLRDGLAERTTKGEIVLVIGRAEAVTASATEIDAALVAALRHLPVKAAASEVAEAFGLKRRDAYQRALALRDEGTE